MFIHIKKLSLRRGFGIFLLGFLCLLVGGFVFLAITTKGDPVLRKLEREQKNTEQKIVNDVTELNPLGVLDIVVPHSEEEIVDAVKRYPRVSVGGGRNSMGGQTASERAVQLDMREYNKILSLNKEKKEITVQSGIRWRDIQDTIDEYDLSIKIMQTYSNFTVGGSLSVNVHGRYIGLGPIILSVKNIRVVLADGRVVTASPSENQEVFYAAIGGMGGIGVITDVTLELEDNVHVERSQERVSLSEYASFFNNNVRNNSQVLFHNGDMYPPDFSHISAVSWVKTDKPITVESRLIPRKKDYWLERTAWIVMSEWPFGRQIRQYVIDPLLYSGKSPVHTRNYEASYDTAELEPSDRTKSTYVLQEYFVPVEKFDEWVPKMKKVFNDYDVNVINVSIRHALPDTGSTLAWAKTESFAFVVYYKQDTDKEAIQKVGNWTREMIDQVLSVGGTYYLPYQLHATDDQFHRAYPRALEYFEIKKRLDPTNKFTNKLWDKYYDEDKVEYYKQRQEIFHTEGLRDDYIRPYKNSILALPEWYIVYSAEEYARSLVAMRPSQFSYFFSIKEYWRQYRIVTQKIAPEEAGDYGMVLKVIGVSFTVENAIKGVYENTVGSLTEYIAGYKKVSEDLVAEEVARDYGAFLYDYPWYDFPFAQYISKVWITKETTPITVGQFIRKIERRIILTVELSLKSGYSKIIAYFTHKQFGVQDDIIQAIISRDNGKTFEVLEAPHYHPFTKVLTGEMDAALEKGSSFEIYDIAGNQQITFSFVADKDFILPEKLRVVLVSDEAYYDVDSYEKEMKRRFTVEASVKDIFEVYKELLGQDVRIAHFYDY
ncbi:MAG: FAD-binding oxidoreductase [Candidatus Moranbacteria bacterium]|nr:FAD-binding oxidoreductase [Candidatus Moranbacteria bacterium]